MSFTTPPNDPLFANAWHLSATGGSSQPAGLPVGFDIRALSAWSHYTGRNILVGVLDDAVQKNQPDLAANIWVRPAGITNLDPNGQSINNFSAPGSHGTASAGIIAAVGNNGIGGVGVAPNAKIAAYNGGSGFEFALTAFRQAALDGVQVMSNSWGGDGAFEGNGDPQFTAALNTLGGQGRGGLGTIITFAEGNARQYPSAPGLKTDGGLDMTTGSRYVVAVASVEAAGGKVASYSTAGANLLVSAPGGHADNDLTSFTGILTTDLTGAAGENTAAGDAGNYFGADGTSAATPVVSGVVALMLEANARLGYRDVQEILAYTARQIDLDAGTTSTANGQVPWVTTHAGNANGGGLSFSRDYGFGLVDAGAAVRLAETWTASRADAGLITATANAAATGSITTGGLGTVQTFTTSFNIAQPAGAFTGFRTDRLELTLNLNASRPSDLTILLTSPDGTTITMMDRPGNAFAGANKSFNPASPVAWPAGGFTIGTPAFWGEKGVGTWTLSISASANAVAASVTGASLTLLGDGSAGGAADLRMTDVITDDYGRLATLDASRGTLGGGGKTAINAAPMTGVVSIDLSGANASSLGGRAVTLTGSTLKDLVGGAANDTLLGNDLANALSGSWGNDVLRGGGGNDTLEGGDGDDILDGGTGVDSMNGGGGNDQYLVDSAGDIDVEALHGGIDTAWVSTNGWTVAANIEVVRLYGLGTQVTGNDGVDTIVANAGAASSIAGAGGDDTLWGSGLANTLDGGAGDDIIRGLDGASRMIGGAGNDQFVVGNLGVVIAENADEGIDTAWLAVSGWTNFLNVEIARLAAPGAVVLFGSAGSENLVANSGAASRLDGNAGDDTLWGSPFADTLNGGAGDDIMRGQGGADVMAGGIGNDQYVVFDTAATVTENAGEGYDIVYFAGPGSVFIGENVEEARLVAQGTGLRGNAQANLMAGNSSGLGSTLDGGAGDDIIFGTAAADVFIGGAGNDTMYSQGGADIFDYTAPGWGLDQIAGFTAGSRLQFEAASGVTSFAQLNLNIAGGNTQVNHANGVILVFGAVLAAGDFLFV